MSKTKTMLMLILAGSVVFSMFFWFGNIEGTIDFSEYTIALLVGIIVLLSVIVASKRIKNENKGLPADDELSNRIKERAAAVSFTGSFIVWNFILLFLANKELSNSAVIGVGIIAQGILFFGAYFYYSKKGVSDGNTN